LRRGTASVPVPVLSGRVVVIVGADCVTDGGWKTIGRYRYLRRMAIATSISGR
jgi:hypothetical protein